MENSNQNTGPSVLQRNRRQLIIIMVIAFLSLGGSYLVFYFAYSQGTWGTTNNGEFVQPPLNIAELGWQSTEQGRFWWLWVLADQQCADDCQAMTKDLRALHILLNREAKRLRRGITLKTGAAPELPEAFPKLERIKLLTSPDELPNRLREGIYIIDPNGNFVLRYEMQVDPKSIQQDLKKLLKVSQIG